MRSRRRLTARSAAAILLATLVLALSVLVDVPSAAAATTPLYPDLRTLPPRSLKLDRADVSADGSGQMHNVLRFSNTAWNAGEGNFVLRAAINPTTKSGTAYQRIYDTSGAFVEQPVGTIYYHAVHNHYHFEGWGRYELWTKSAYDAWVASGRTTGAPQWTSPKTTSCVLDEESIDDLPATPANSVYSWQGCTLAPDNTLSMGLSPGWGDTYDYYRFEQWIDLNQATLGDGQYVLRSVTDPTNVLWESDQRADPIREGDNEATTAFSIASGAIQDGTAPSGTVWLNGVDSSTSNTVVNVRVVGRDDVSGVDQIRISNNGTTWKQQAFTGVDSTPMELSWDLADATYGGSSASGTHTVYVQLHDASGKWSSSITDTIDLVTCAAGTSSSGYASTITGDAPVSWWRLGESCGTSARDERNANNGTYANGPTLAQPSLLTADGASTSVRFDGVDDNVSIPSSASLALGAALSLEAWIKPTSLPAAGGWASVLTKPEAYSLQFNGPQLELTIMQNGARRRLQAPAGAVVAGTTYHVVGTYNGTTARLYLNGVQAASLALTGPASTTSSSLTIGSWGGSEYFNGVIDEVAVYNRALDPAQIANHNTAGRTTTPMPPTAPTNLSANAASESSINVMWTDTSNNETGFVYERSTSSSFTSPVIKSFPPDVTTYTDTGLAPGTTYWCRIKATNGTGDSAYSNVASATTQSSTPPPPPSGYASAVTADSPTSWWRLGEASGTSAADARGVNPASYLNAPALGQPSLLGTDTTNTAVGFDGTNDNVNAGTGPSLTFASAFTLEAWIKPAALPATSAFASILTKAESYSLQLNGPRLEFTLMQGGARRRLQAPAGAVVAGTTYHVVGTYDGTTQRLYLDGALVASAARTGIATATSSALRIGSWDGGSEFFKGTIDEVAVYGTALAAARVTAHTDAGRSSTPPPPPTPPAAPSNLTAIATSSSRVDASWTDNASNETAIVLERSTSSTFSSPTTVTLAPNTATYADTTVSPSTTYYLRVKATNSAGDSAYSGTATVTTPAAPAPSAYAAVVAADGAFSHWRLGEASGTSAADARGANAGIYFNGPTLAQPSLLPADTGSTSVRFDGTNDYVNVPAAPSLDLTSSFSLEAWIRPSALPATGGWASILTKAESYSLQFNGPRLEFTVMQSGTRRRLQAPAGAIVAGTTYHVVATYDGTTQRLYVNGALVASAALSGGASVTANAVRIGSWGGGSEFFAGTIDEVAVYALVLTPSQIANHNTKGRTG